MAKLKNLDDLSSQIWKEINDLKTQIPALLVRVNEVDVKISDEVKALLTYKRSIEQLKSKFREYEDIYNDIVSKMGVIKTSQQESSDILKEIKETKNSVDTISSAAFAIKEAIDKNPNIVDDIETMNGQLADISNAHTEIEKHQTDIVKIHKVIFGYDSENKETGEVVHTKGLKDELDIAYKVLKENIAKIEQNTQTKYDSQIAEWEKQYIGLKGRIESLLPGAMQAGLAHAYQVKRRLEETRLKESYRKFGWTIFYLISTAAIQLLAAGYWLFIDNQKLSFVFENMPAVTIGLLPIFGALIWLGIYQNKSLNLTKKLIEEYFHKEASARTFEGLSKQITDLGDNELANSLKMKLLDQTLDAAAKNPSECITGHEKSDNPFFTLFGASSKLIKQFGGTENVAKFCSTLAEIYTAQSRKEPQNDSKSNGTTNN
ncbi:MAG: hypothetical protein FWG80_01815 [Alphaproteobacteria bacterium]|nr:hypothetical protein [Alphaproteobacteria bacterium]